MIAMKSTITKIFSGISDDAVHNDFVKFSKGVFENRYLLEGKRQKEKWSIKTGAEFANFLVRKCLENFGGDVEVKGAIICTRDIKEDLDFEIKNVKNYMGIKQFQINSKIAAGSILNLMDKYPRAFFALTFSIENCNLKIKAKPPKSGKPGKKGEEEPKADFCSLKTNNSEIVSDLFFDFPDFKEIKIKHTVEIKEIEIPKDTKTPEEMREKAVRKGVIKRIVNVDGESKESEKEFSA